MATPPLQAAAPAGFVPEHVMAMVAADGTALAVAAANPLPTVTTLTSSSSTPLAGNATGAIVAGPFVPQLGRAIWLTLSGNWSGSLIVQRSVDGGATLLPLTVGGQSWANFSSNCNEPIGEESVAGASYYLAIAVTAGTLAYRVAQ